MKLLEQTVRELKGEELEDEARATVTLHVDLRIDEGYVPDMNQRLMTYRKVAAARSEAELQQVLEEMRDRYGPLPPSVLNLADYGRIRILADRLGVESLNREGHVLVLKFRAAQATIDPVKLVALVRARRDLMLVPPAMLKLDLKVAGEPERTAGRRKAASRSASWWTARATAGEVKPGFSREEILKPATEDPREPGGLFHRVEALLRQLRQMG
jgi:transcription-repair coupling factor (superfamily II helicase)